MVSISVGGALALGAAGSIGSSLLSSSAATDAAKLQTDAANTASANQLAEFNQNKATLAPFVGAGTSSLTALQKLTGTDVGGNPLTAPLTRPFQPTMDELAKTPGYQFTLGQGLQNTQNSYAAQGLGQSGAALKGAANYAEGLASTTYQQQFQNYLNQNSQIYSMLGGQASLGENAAATTGNQGIQATANAGNFLTSGAAAGAGGIVGSANAINAGLSNVSNTGLVYALGNNSGLFGSGSGGGISTAGNGGSSATSPF